MTNRALRRAARRHVGHDPVLLMGGPMDGWYVKPDAPALDPGWGELAGFPGWRYERTGPDENGVEEARWVSA